VNISNVTFCGCNRFTINELISLFTSMDSFCIAYLIMGPVGQLEFIFDEATKGFGSSAAQDADFGYAVNFDVHGFMPGAAVFTAAAIVDQVFAFFFMAQHRKLLGGKEPDNESPYLDDDGEVIVTAIELMEIERQPVPNATEVTAEEINDGRCELPAEACRTRDTRDSRVLLII